MKGLASQTSVRRHNHNCNVLWREDLLEFESSSWLLPSSACLLEPNVSLLKLVWEADKKKLTYAQTDTQTHD